MNWYKGKLYFRNIAKELLVLAEHHGINTESALTIISVIVQCFLTVGLGCTGAMGASSKSIEVRIAVKNTR
jgi:hypothetical protein